MTLGDRWSELPGAARWTIALVALAIGYGLVYSLVASVAPDSWGEQTIRLVIVALTLPALVGGAFVQRRRLGGRGQLGLYRQAFRTGQVPQGAHRERWLPVARKQERCFREGRMFFRVTWAILVVLVLALVPLLVLADVSVWWSPLVVLVPLVPFVWWMDRLWVRRRDRLASVVRQLGDDPGETSSARSRD